MHIITVLDTVFFKCNDKDNFDKDFYFAISSIVILSEERDKLHDEPHIKYKGYLKPLSENSF